MPGGIRVGEEITKDHGMLLDVLASGKQKGGFLPKEVLGLPVMDIVTPIFESNTVVGLVMYTASKEEQAQILESSNTLNHALHNSKAEINIVPNGITELAQTLYLKTVV